MKAVVVGSGAWGTALSLRLCKNGHDVVLWSFDPKEAAQMLENRENPMLPGVKLPENLAISTDIACVAGRQLVVVASPSFAVRQVSRNLAPYLDKDAVVVSVAKGVEASTQLRMSQIIEQETGKTVVALTGPSHAEEVGRGLPTGCLAACTDKKMAEFVQDAFMADVFRIYTSPDIVGAELGGALKNIIALCAGVTEGLGYGDNIKAMLMTRGLTEMARLGVSLGASKETFAGLAGVGDLIVTCTSQHSRNHRAGVLIGKGVAPKEAMKQVGAVVEGYYAAEAAWQMCQKQGVEMPIVQAAYAVLYEGVSAEKVIEILLHRHKKAESEDSGWQ